MTFIDLSGTIEPNEETKITYYDHALGAEYIKGLFNLPPELLRDEEGWSGEAFTTFFTHSCTHVDAPWHYNSKIQGKKAAAIDELPLEWFYSDGVVLDMMHKETGDVVSVDDIKNELERIAYQLKPLDIVLVKNGQDKYLGDEDYSLRGSGVSAAATHWLYDQGVRVMGIDAWGWDAPLYLQADEALKKNEKGIFWAAHQANIAYSQIERLVNLGALPPHGFKVSCFPLKIKNGSGAPARVVAILDD